MPSFFHPFAGLSCLNCSAVAVVDTPPTTPTEQEMIDAFTGRPSTTYGTTSSPNVESPLQQLSPTKENVIYPSDKNNNSTRSRRSIYPDKNNNNSTRSSRSIYTTTSRRASMRSLLSRADSCYSTQSGVSVRSTPWFMRHISPSIIFSDEVNHHHDDDPSMEEKRDGSTTHRSSSSHDPPCTSSNQDMIEEDQEITTKDYYDEEEEEEAYIFSNSNSCSGSSCSVAANEPLKSKHCVVNENTTTLNNNIEEFISQKNESFRVSSLLGPNIVRLHATDDETKVTSYSTDETLQNSALVGLYHAKANQCRQTTEYVRLFTAGYYHSSLDGCGDDNDKEKDPNELQALSIVFWNANEDEDVNGMVVPPNLPSEWYTLPPSTDMQRHILKELDIVTTAGPTLVIFDPMSGRIICSNAILDIIHLDRNDVDQYDNEAFQLYDSWLQQLTTAPEVDQDSRHNSGRMIRFEQFNVDSDDAGRVTIEYTDGERSSYERSLPYSI